eukprot:TRINITY_DN4613_c0_g1_i1.p1 TRINITY_DN4613_c0_g1~~TRINITY_DN4613_c0_g1_i1.p1  ORF type:complete len:197 (-),score=43.93 TRINITY_DN4613_c0_g1_i1:1172-1762(-)
MALSPDGRGSGNLEEYEGEGHHGEDGDGEGGGGAGMKDQERFLPVANISRIMKKGLPNNAKIAKDAKETMQECVSEFISFITSEASDKCQREKRKTINGDDLLWAMSTLGFEDYVEPLKMYLQRFREVEGEKVMKPAGGGGGPGEGPREVVHDGGAPSMQAPPRQIPQSGSFKIGAGGYGQQAQWPSSMMQMRGQP